MISCMIGSGGPRTLRANLFQDPKEQHRLKTCKEAVARFLRETVSDHIGDGMRKKGVGEEEAEVDTVYNGSFENFAAKGEAEHSQGQCYVRKRSESACGNLFRQPLRCNEALSD